MKNNSSKILVAYFTRSGHTRKIAEEIHEAIDCDLFEIVPEVSYPSDYDECVSLAGKEQDENARPKLTSHVKGMDDYDVVFVGYPNWWGTMPMPVFTFLEEYNLSGKTVIPFCTHGGSAMGKSETDISRICRNANVLKGLAIYGTRVNQSNREVVKWLDKVSRKSNTSFLFYNPSK